MKLFDIFRRLTLVPQGLTIVTAAFLPILAITTMFPALPSIIDHFASDPGARWKVPLMVSAPGLSIAIIAPFAGWFVDKVGRRPLLVGATLLYGVVGTAPFFLDSIDAIFASRLLLGVAEAAILTIVNTLIGDYWDDSRRRDWLMIQGLLGPFLASGVILMSGTATAIRWNGIFLVYLIAFPIFVAMLAFLFEPKRADGITIAEIAQKPAVASPFPTRWIVMTGIVTLATSALYYVFIINGGLAFREVGIQSSARLGELTAIPSLFVLLGAALFRVLSRAPNAVQLGTLFLLMGGGIAGIGFAPDYRWMLAALVVQQTGAGMSVPALIAWTQTGLPFEHRGRGMGIWTGCFFFGQFSSPFFVHRLDVGTHTMQGAFIGMGLFGLACSVLAYATLLRRPKVGAPLAAS